MKAEGADSGEVEDADNTAIDFERVTILEISVESRSSCNAVEDVSKGVVEWSSKEDRVG